MEVVTKTWSFSQGVRALARVYSSCASPADQGVRESLQDLCGSSTNSSRVPVDDPGGQDPVNMGPANGCPH